MEEEEKERKKEERIRKREQKLREKEERRNLKKVKRQQEQEQKKLQVKIALEERRLLLAQRNLESIRLIAELLARAKVLNEHSTALNYCPPGYSAATEVWNIVINPRKDKEFMF